MTCTNSRSAGGGHAAHDGRVESAGGRSRRRVNSYEPPRLPPRTPSDSAVHAWRKARLLCSPPMISCAYEQNFSGHGHGMVDNNRSAQKFDAQSESCVYPIVKVATRSALDFGLKIVAGGLLAGAAACCSSRASARVASWCATCRTTMRNLLSTTSRHLLPAAAAPTISSLCSRSRRRLIQADHSRACATRSMVAETGR